MVHNVPIQQDNSKFHVASINSKLISKTCIEGCSFFANCCRERSQESTENLTQIRRESSDAASHVTWRGRITNAVLNLRSIMKVQLERMNEGKYVRKNYYS